MNLKTTGIAGATSVMLLTLGCASQQKIDPTEARAAVYTAEYDKLLKQVALEVKSVYPNLQVAPNERMIKTAWHPLPFSETVEGKEDVLRYNKTASGKKADGQLGDQNTDYAKRRAFRRNNTTRETIHFVRFDVSIEPAGAPGGPPWKVVVAGNASEQDGTGAPVVLNGAARPYWLDGRVAALEVKIHKRVKHLASR